MVEGERRSLRGTCIKSRAFSRTLAGDYATNGKILNLDAFLLTMQELKKATGCGLNIDVYCVLEISKGGPRGLQRDLLDDNSLDRM